jgi:hypothetical protein
MAMCEALNAIPLKAGLARYVPVSPLAKVALRKNRIILTAITHEHGPNHAVLSDRLWNGIDANHPAQRLIGAFPRAVRASHYTPTELERCCKDD